MNSSYSRSSSRMSTWSTICYKTSITSRWLSIWISLVRRHSSGYLSWWGIRVYWITWLRSSWNTSITSRRCCSHTPTENSWINVFNWCHGRVPGASVYCSVSLRDNKMVPLISHPTHTALKCCSRCSSRMMGTCRKFGIYSLRYLSTSKCNKSWSPWICSGINYSEVGSIDSSTRCRWYSTCHISRRNGRSNSWSQEVYIKSWSYSSTSSLISRRDTLSYPFLSS